MKSEGDQAKTAERIFLLDSQVVLAALIRAAESARKLEQETKKRLETAPDSDPGS